MFERHFWKLVAVGVLFIWSAIAWAAVAHAGNPSEGINNVERAVSKWKPYKATKSRYQFNGRTYVCRFFDDAPNVASQDFTWQVVVCRVVKTGAKA